MDLFANHVCKELDFAVHALLVNALYFIVEARKAIERLLECEEVIEHGLRLRIPPFTRQPNPNTRRIDQRQCRRDSSLDFVQSDVIDLVCNKSLIGFLGAHSSFRKTRCAETKPL